MKVSQLFIYPIKSTHPLALSEAEVCKHSIRYDREWALFDMEGQALTARDYPILLDVMCSPKEDQLSISYQGNEVGRAPLNTPTDLPEELRIFSYQAHGTHVSGSLDSWFTTLLSKPCKLMRVALDRERNVLPKHGGSATDALGFGDQAPLLILSEASVQDLNTRLSDNIGLNRFRPNIVISGCPAYTEDSWKLISIGTTKLKIIQQCERCVFTTIDPITKQKHDRGEPLRTLSTYRKGPQGGVVFGVHAVPINQGKIKVGDPITMV